MRCLLTAICFTTLKLLLHVLALFFKMDVAFLLGTVSIWSKDKVRGFVCVVGDKDKDVDSGDSLFGLNFFTFFSSNSDDVCCCC